MVVFQLLCMEVYLPELHNLDQVLHTSYDWYPDFQEK